MTAVGATLRVIAGEWRGRRLAVPAQGTRPMADRVRESVFAVLEPRIAGARILDLCAGSGALAIEALSRGAAEAVLVERAPAAVAVARANLAALGADDRASIVAGDALRYLAEATGAFELILADPPYDDSRLRDGILGGVAARRELLPVGALLVLTGRALHRGDTRPTPDGLRCARSMRYGDTCVDLIERVATRGEEESR